MTLYFQLRSAIKILVLKKKKCEGSQKAGQGSEMTVNWYRPSQCVLILVTVSSIVSAFKSVWGSLLILFLGSLPGVSGMWIPAVFCS